MTLFEKFIQYDKQLLVYLNNLGNENWDLFWITITNFLAWIPLFLLFFYFIFKTYGWKKGIVFVFLIALLITFSDQFANLVKNTFERLRPNRDPSINEFIRVLKNNKSFSFYSAHAATSMAVTTFLYHTLKNDYKYTVLFFIWPLFFAYSRIYLGVHFPFDILIGGLMGSLIGYLFYRLSQHVFSRFFSKI